VHPARYPSVPLDRHVHADGARFQESDPRRTLEAIEPFPWAGPQPRYFMFERKIAGWSTAEQVAADLKGFTP